MKKEELELLLKDVVTPISKIEAELKMPKTTLQKALKGTRGLSKKWSLALVKWVTYEEAPTTKRSEPEKVPENSADGTPKNMNELRAMCPIKSGIERTMWINEKKVQFGL